MCCAISIYSSARHFRRGDLRVFFVNSRSSSPIRCRWAGTDKLMVAYHDEEWGVPQRNSRKLWEMLMLEGFQAGLSWSTILNKRVAFRKAFAGFDPEKVAKFGTRDIRRLLGDAGIVRTRAKIEGTSGGGRVYCGMLERGEKFSAFFWSFTEGEPLTGNGKTVLASTPL